MADLIARAITALADIETRLRRSLRLVGEVGTAFHPDATTASIHVDDATRPGCNSQSGRAWVQNADFGAVGGNTWIQYLVAEVPIWIEEINVDAQYNLNFAPPINDAGVYATLYGAAPNSFVLPAGIAGFPARYQERPGAEVAPIAPWVDGPPAAIVAGFSFLDAMQVLVGQQHSFLPRRIYLDVGAAIAVEITVAAGVVGNFGQLRTVGRLF